MTIAVRSQFINVEANLLPQIAALRLLSVKKEKDIAITITSAPRGLSVA